MNPKVHIWALPNGSKATMSITSPDATMDDVELALMMDSIVEGIQKDAITKALEIAHTTGEPQYNIIIAQAQIGESQILLGKRVIPATLEKLHELKNTFQAINSAIMEMKNGKQINDLPEGLFISKDEVFCKIIYKEGGNNIYGKPIPKSGAISVHLPCDSSIYSIRQDNGLEYIAKKDGYLVALTSDKFSIAEQFYISSDKMEMTFYGMPVWWNRKALISSVYNIATPDEKSRNSGLSIPSKEEFNAWLQTGSSFSFVVKKGKKAIPGKDGQLKLFVDTLKKPVENDNGRVDYKEMSLYQQVEKGTILAEKIFPIEGMAGVNAIGEAIDVEPVKDIEFKAGKNIIEQDSGIKSIFIAACSGILKLSGNSIEILDVLRIVGDVGPEVGNVRSEKDVIITGNILGGYTVECGSNLTIEGVIENGATVICKKSLIVQHGIFGKQTKVKSYGDGVVGFIQDSNIRVDGELHVRKFIYNSNVYCGKKLTVDGIGIKGDARGCVLGGEIIAMQCMLLDSVGCEGETTRLFCGVNPIVIQTVQEIKVKISVYNKKATAIRTALKMDLNASDIKEKLKALPDREKERVKKLLLEMKMISKEQVDIMEKLKPLEKMAKNENPELCNIEITKNVIPQVIIKIGNDIRIESKRKYYVIYKYNKENINDNYNVN